MQHLRPHRFSFQAMLWSLFVFSLLTLPGSSALAQTEAEGSLQGLVTSTEGESLPGATVRLGGTQIGAATDSDGRYRITGIPSGTYEVNVRFVGFEPLTSTITIESGANLTRDFTLTPRAIALEGAIVTAQKRVQTFEEVPVAISSVDGQRLDELDLETFDTFSAYVPGLEVQLQSPNNPGFVVRGITSDSGDSRIEPRVSVFQDGVSISKSRGSVVELFDMERIEVLKGPQGTLFGRGAQIGAVHLIQNKAENTTGGSVTVGTGNFNERYATGYANTPLTESLFVRLAGIYSQRDGTIDNRVGGALNGKETLAGRLALRWLPTDQTVVDLIGNAQQDTPPGIAFDSRPSAFNIDPFERAAMGGNDPVLRDDDLFVDRTVWGVTLLVDHAFSSALTLNSITAYREFDSLERFDADGTPAPVLQFDEEAFGQQLSQEVRLTYDGGGRVQGFGGANVYWEDGYQRVPFRTDERSFYALLSPQLDEALPADLPVVPLLNPDGTPNLSVTRNPLTGAPFKESHREVSTNFGTLTAAEIFIDGTVDITPRWSATAGLRGTFEDVTGALEVPESETPGSLGLALGASPNNLFAPTDGRVSRTETFASAVGRLATSYEIADPATVFASVARGRRPNVIQATTSGTDVLNNEIVWSYDAGIKGIAAQDRLQYSLTGFYYDYFNFQTSVTELTEEGLVDETRDSGNATAFGGEAEVQWAPAAGLSLFGSYGYVNATFDDTDNEGREQELAGNRFRLTPEHTFALGGELAGMVDPVGRLFLRPSVTYKSQVFFEAENDPGIEQEGYALVNVRAGAELAGGQFTIEGYVENLTDEEYLIDGGNTGGAFGIPTFIPGPPRFFGIRLNARL